MKLNVKCQQSMSNLDPKIHSNVHDENCVENCIKKILLTMSRNENYETADVDDKKVHVFEHRMRKHG